MENNNRQAGNERIYLVIGAGQIAGFEVDPRLGNFLAQVDFIVDIFQAADDRAAAFGVAAQIPGGVTYPGETAVRIGQAVFLDSVAGIACAPAEGCDDIAVFRYRVGNPKSTFGSCQ